MNPSSKTCSNCGSIKGINKCERYKIKIEFEFGDHYKNLKDGSGERLDLVTTGNEVTDKQQAQAEIERKKGIWLDKNFPQGGARNFKVEQGNLEKMPVSKARTAT